MKRLTFTLLMTSVLSLTACQTIHPTTPKTATITQSGWAKEYLELLNSGQDINHKHYTKLYKTLNDINTKSGATYTYIIMPIEHGKASINGNPKGDFMLTLDGSDEPEEWATVYEHEVQFTEAWQGQIALARSAWRDDDGSVLWSAFAPIYHNGQVIALLGIDYPADDVISKHPEWNRDDPRWNGFTDKITGKIPPTIQQKRTALTKLMKQYAKELNRQ